MKFEMPRLNNRHIGPLLVAFCIGFVVAGLFLPVAPSGLAFAASPTTLNMNAIPNQFKQITVADVSGAAFTAIQGQPGQYIKVWRYDIDVSNGSNFGFASSGGRILRPKSGGVGTGTSYRVMDFPPAHAFVPWAETDISEGLNITYDAGNANGIITYTVEAVQ